jgi:hypothetical protein
MERTKELLYKCTKKTIRNSPTCHRRMQSATTKHQNLNDGTVLSLLVSVPDATLKSSINLGKLLEQSLADVLVVNVDERASNVAVQVGAVGLRELDLVELSGLLEVDVVVDLAQVVLDVAVELLLWKSAGLLLDVQLVGELGGEVGPGALVSADREVSVTVEVGNAVEWAVDGNLLVVNANAVARGVVVGEQTRLQDRIIARLPAFDRVGGAEVRLLDLGVVVIRVLGEDHAADVMVSDVEPVLGQVQDVVAVGCGFFFGHGGNGDLPCRVVTLLDGVVQVFGAPGVVLTGLLRGLGIGEVANALLRFELDASVHPASIVLDELVGVTRPTVHVSEAIWRSEVREKTQEL